MIGFSSDNYSEYVNLYPNPSEGRFTVEAGQEIPGGSLILRIVNLSGSVVQDVVMNDQDRRQDFDITSSPAGGYILMLLNGDRIVATKKLLKR